MASFISTVALILALFEDRVGAPLIEPVSSGILCASVITSMSSCVTFLMLRFYFDAIMRTGYFEQIMVWVPLVLLDISIAELFVGVGLWHCNSHSSSTLPCQFLVGYIVALCCCCLTISFAMFFRMKHLRSTPNTKDK